MESHLVRRNRVSRIGPGGVLSCATYGRHATPKHSAENAQSGNFFTVPHVKGSVNPPTVVGWLHGSLEMGRVLKRTKNPKQHVVSFCPCNIVTTSFTARSHAYRKRERTKKCTHLSSTAAAPAAIPRTRASITSFCAPREKRIRR